MGKKATGALEQDKEGKAINVTGSYMLELYSQIISPHM